MYKTQIATTRTIKKSRAVAACSGFGMAYEYMRVVLAGQS